jgi:hypothetical protein
LEISGGMIFAIVRQFWAQAVELKTASKIKNRQNFHPPVLIIIFKKTKFMIV